MRQPLALNYRTPGRRPDRQAEAAADGPTRLASFWRELGERHLGNWSQRRREMRLNLLMTLLALTLAAVAGQSPFF